MMPLQPDDAMFSLNLLSLERHITIFKSELLNALLPLSVLLLLERESQMPLPVFELALLPLSVFLLENVREMPHQRLLEALLPLSMLLLEEDRKMPLSLYDAFIFCIFERVVFQNNIP
jgi:hypothetical protein